MLCTLVLTSAIEEIYFSNVLQQSKFFLKYPIIFPCPPPCILLPMNSLFILKTLFCLSCITHKIYLTTVYFRIYNICFQRCSLKCSVITSHRLEQYVRNVTFTRVLYCQLNTPSVIGTAKNLLWEIQSTGDLLIVTWQCNKTYLKI